MTRKFLNILLCCVLVFGAAKAGVFTSAYAAEIIRSNSVGNLAYTLDSDGLLTISGSGMLDMRFGYDKTIKKVIINDGITSVGSFVFEHCSRITSVTLPDAVTTIGYGAFSHCSKLASINIPDSVNTIGKEAFMDCFCLTEINIPDGVSLINDYTFAGCTGLASITIPKTVTAINRSAFNYCTGLTNVTIPGSVTLIDSLAFKYCINLQSVQFESGDVTILEWAFSQTGNADTRTVITIPSGKTVIEEDAFKSSYTDVYFLGDLPEFEGKLNSDKSGEVICYYPCGNETWNTSLPETAEWRAVHVWNDGEITKEPTAEAEGEKTFACTVCGAEKTESIPKTEAEFTPGDVDGNGQVLADDARLALRASAKLEILDEKQAKTADVDGSGEVMADDARQILRFSAKLQQEFVKK